MQTNKLFIENESAIRYTLRTLNLRKVDIDDLVQDTYLKMRQSIEKGVYKENGQFRSWITTMARNLALDRMRSNSRGRIKYKMIELDNTIANETRTTYHEIIGKDPMIEEINWKELQIDHENWKKFIKAYNKLKPNFKQTMDLHLYAGMKFKEIAKIQNCSIMTSLGRFRYGKKALIKELTNGDNEIQIDQHNATVECLQ